MAQKRKRNKRWIYWLLMLVLLVVAGVVVYLVWDNYFSGNKPDDNQSSGTVQVDDEVSDMSNTMEDVEQIDESVEKKKVEQYDGDDPNKAVELSGAITFAQAVDDKLMIRVNIDQYLESGECKLTIKKNDGEIYSDTVGIINNASTATCEGYDVAVNKLGSGKMELIIELNSGGKKGIISGEVNL